MPDTAPTFTGAEPTEPGAGQGLRVLVVDDSDDAAGTLALLLQMSGHTTATAADGMQALRQAASFQPDAVVLDIGLPGMGGLELATRLRSSPGGLKLLLVALSGLSQAPDQLASHDAGCDAHLVKPVKLDQLFKLLTDHQASAAAVVPASSALPTPRSSDGGDRGDRH